MTTSSLRDQLLREQERAPGSSVLLPGGWRSWEPAGITPGSVLATHVRAAIALVGRRESAYVFAPTEQTFPAQSLIGVERIAGAGGLDAVAADLRARLGAAPLARDPRLLRWVCYRDGARDGAAAVSVHYLLAYPDSDRRRGLELVASRECSDRADAASPATLEWAQVMDAVVSTWEWH